MIKSYFRVLSPRYPGSQAIRSLWCFWLGRHDSARDVSELHKGLHPAPRLHPTTPTASRPPTRSRYIQSILGVGAVAECVSPSSLSLPTSPPIHSTVRGIQMRRRENATGTAARRPSGPFSAPMETQGLQDEPIGAVETRAFDGKS
jgi:hypothetical protein